jgi:uncharacterized caspase-like protein
MAEALKEIGFDVTSAPAAHGLAQFATTPTPPSKPIGLFYCRHGMQLAWRNYLLPVDAVWGMEDAEPLPRRQHRHRRHRAPPAR